MSDDIPFSEHLANVKEAQRVYNNANRHAILANEVSREASRIQSRIMALPVVAVIGVMAVIWLEEREALYCFITAFVTGHAAQIAAAIKYNVSGCRAFITALASAMAFSARAVNALGDEHDDRSSLLRALRAAMNMEDLIGYGDVHELLRRLPAKARVRVKVKVEKEMGNFKELTDQQLADLF